MSSPHAVINSENKSNWRKIPVPCFPLMSILSALKIFTVDYLYLNAFGHELQILQNIPWNEVEIKVINTISSCFNVLLFLTKNSNLFYIF